MLLSSAPGHSWLAAAALSAAQARGTGWGPRKIGEVAQDAETAELSSRGRLNWLRPGIVATPHTQGLASPFQDLPHLRRPPENRERHEKKAAAAAAAAQCVPTAESQI